MIECRWRWWGNLHTDEIGVPSDPAERWDGSIQVSPLLPRGGKMFVPRGGSSLRSATTLFVAPDVAEEIESLFGYCRLGDELRLRRLERARWIDDGGPA